jgi:hypothetical protein
MNSDQISMILGLKTVRLIPEKFKDLQIVTDLLLIFQQLNE